MILTIPLAEFIAELQRLHAQQDNHPMTQLRVTADGYSNDPELFVSSNLHAGGTIVATCFK
jgi:hypothetical protein